MFPPLTSSSHNRVAGWALHNGLPEDERELELVLEIWVEPQHGVIVKNENPEYLVGKQYFEIPAQVVFLFFFLCVFSISVVEYIYSIVTETGTCNIAVLL